MASGNLSTTIDPFRTEEAWFASREIELLFGSVLSLLTIFGILENGIAFAMLIKFRSEFSSHTATLLTSLAVSDGIMSVIGGTMFSIAAFSHTWIWGFPGCIFYAFVMYATGCVSITHLMLISIDRMLAITQPIRYNTIGRSKAVKLAYIITSWVYGTIWAVFPLLGFQTYGYEGSISCSINWFSRKPIDIAYNLTIFIMVYFLPALIIIGSYSFIYLTIRKSGKSLVATGRLAQKKTEAERKLAVNLMMTTVAYLLIWLPYAVVSMFGSFGDPSVIPPAARGFPAVIAKTSMVFNPLVYIATNKMYRLCYINICDRKRIKLMLGIKGTVEPVNAENTVDSDADESTGAGPSTNTMRVTPEKPKEAWPAATEKPEPEMEMRKCKRSSVFMIHKPRRFLMVP